MAAEDYIDVYDWSDYVDVDYEVQYQDEPPYQKQYTDKVTFNGRKLRTERQIEHNFKFDTVMFDKRGIKVTLDKLKENKLGEFLTRMKTGQRTGVSYDLEDLIGQEVVVQVSGKERFPLITKEQVEANKFYISSPNVFVNNWGHPTLDETIKHAQDMLLKRKDINEVAIVEIVRIVRRKPIEVDIETV